MARDVEAGRAFVRVSVKDQMNLAGLSKKLKAWGASMAGMGKSMSIVGGLLSYPLAMAVKNFADFDDAMLAVKGVTQATTDDWQMLTKTAKDLGATTSFTAVQVAALMVELGRAGFNPSEIDTMTGAVLNLARATGTDATLASGIMAASIRQFNLDATQAARVADVLTAGANKSFNTVESLGEAMQYAGPVALDFGMSIEDTVAILGQLGNVGIQGSNAGTALRRLLTITGAEADKLKGIFGVTFVDAAGNARPLVDVLEEVNNATKDLGTADRAKKFNEAFGLLGITSASAISKTAGSVKELQSAMYAAEGTAAKTAAEMDSGLGGAMRILMSAVEGVKISFGNALSPVLMTIGKVLTYVNEVVRTFIDNNQVVAIVIASVVAALAIGGPLLAAFGFTLMGVGAALGVIATAITAVLSPIGLLAVGIAAGTAAFLTFSETGQSVVTFLNEQFGSLLGFVQGVIGGISDAFKAGDMQLAAQIAWAGVLVAWEETKQALYSSWNAVAGFWDEFWTGLTSIFDGVVTYIRSVWAGVVGWIAEQLLKAWGLIESALAAVGLLNEKTDIGGAVRTLAQDTANQQRALEAAKQARDQERGAGLAARAAGRGDAASSGLAAAKEELAKLLAEASTKAAETVSAEQSKPMTPEEVKKAAQAGSAGGTASFGSFSAAAAGITFAGPQTDDIAKRTEENTRKTAKQLERLNQNVVNNGAAFA